MYNKPRNMTIIWVKFGSYEANIYKQVEQTLFQTTFKMESITLTIKPHISCDLENVPRVTKNDTIV